MAELLQGHCGQLPALERKMLAAQESYSRNHHYNMDCKAFSVLAPSAHAERQKIEIDPLPPQRKSSFHWYPYLFIFPLRVSGAVDPQKLLKGN